MIRLERVIRIGYAGGDVVEVSRFAEVIMAQDGVELVAMDSSIKRT